MNVRHVEKLTDADGRKMTWLEVGNEDGSAVKVKLLPDQAMPGQEQREMSPTAAASWTERPTVDGFYWIRDRNELIVCKVSMREEGNFAVSFFDSYDPVYAWEFGPETLWFGPIDPPEVTDRPPESAPESTGS